MIRLHVTQSLSQGASIAPAAEQARYLTAVMRQAVGDNVLLFNGADGEWRARLSEVSKRGCVLVAEEMTRPQSAGPDLDLIVALVKRARLETIVEKATELGVRRIRLITTRRTNADHTNVSRLQAIATEAAEQTGRMEIPEVVAPEERQRLRGLEHVTPVTLGPRILRADTAAISALTLWQSVLGDWATP